MAFEVQELRARVDISGQAETLCQMPRMQSKSEDQQPKRHTMEVLVGCCGFAGSMKKYFQTFSIVEVQQTFYKIPQLKTLQKWREQAPKDFRFTIKCFQGVTHTVDSPTWRRFGKMPQNSQNYGFLKSTKEVQNSWNQTLDAAKALDAEVIVVQTPPSFEDDRENLANAEKFFSIVKQEKQVAFEPRGWKDDNISSICKKFNLIHCIDPFAANPLWSSKTAYLRLHGSPPGRRMYSYKYTQQDLLRLKNFVESMEADRIYVIFNNISMFEDAQSFMEMI